MFPLKSNVEDGRKCRTIVTMEGENKLVTKQMALEAEKKDVKAVREFNDGGLYLEVTCEDVVTRQMYLRQK